jgi:hypothetical protein
MNANAKRALNIAAGAATGVIGMFSLATFLNGQLLVAILLAVIAVLGLGWYTTVTYLQAVAADQPQTTYTQPRVATRLWLGKGALDEPKQEETWQ